MQVHIPAAGTVYEYSIHTSIRYSRVIFNYSWAAAVMSGGSGAAASRLTHDAALVSDKPLSDMTPSDSKHWQSTHKRIYVVHAKSIERNDDSHDRLRDHVMEELEARPKPRWQHELALALILAMTLALYSVPRAHKKGTVWYTVAHSLMMMAALAAAVDQALFSHYKVARYLTIKAIVRVLCMLNVFLLIAGMIFPDPGWEVTDRINAVTRFLLIGW